MVLTVLSLSLVCSRLLPCDKLNSVRREPTRMGANATWSRNTFPITLAVFVEGPKIRSRVKNHVLNTGPYWRETLI